MNVLSLFEFDYELLILSYCFFTYGWMHSEKKRLYTFMVNDLKNAPYGTTKTHCKVFSWVFWALSPLWFLYWMVNKVK